MRQKFKSYQTAKNVNSAHDTHLSYQISGSGSNVMDLHRPFQKVFNSKPFLQFHLPFCCKFWKMGALIWSQFGAQTCVSAIVFLTTANLYRSVPCCELFKLSLPFFPWLLQKKDVNKSQKGREIWNDHRNVVFIGKSYKLYQKNISLQIICKNP